MTTEMTPAMRRSVLISALRDKTMWPKGFEWDYSRRSCCAIGLAEKLYGEILSAVTGWPALGLSGRDVHYVFVGWVGAQKMVTPEMVADRLEGIHESIQAGANCVAQRETV